LDINVKWNRCRKNESGYIDRNYVFGGSKEKIDYTGFKGGEVNCVFGGIELNLSDSRLAEGIHTLELNTIFGGIVLFVPLDWNIEIRQTQVFGNFVDNRPKPGFEISENSTLILQVASVFGGGEIKCKSK
jgi:predicted membrane protein